MAEKLLADYNDVFADIVNVLLFGGKRVIQEDKLMDTKVRSQYKASDGILHENERDIAKIIVNCNVKIAMFGLEHQTDVDEDMPFRVVDYDGSSYRSQMLKESKERYPVITMVLYFGTTPWDKGRTLYDVLNIQDDFKPFVSNYKINVFEIAFLTPEQVEKFTSDFKIVADYFVQKRTTKDYSPSASVIKHVDAVLKIMTALTGDNSFAESAGSMKNKEGVSMCEIMQRIHTESEAKGEARGRAEGRAEGREDTLRILKDAGILPKDFDFDSLSDSMSLKKSTPSEPSMIEI